MTQEEKQLLFKDLCARLPYGVIVQQSPKYINGDVGYDTASKSEKEPKDFNIIGIEGDNCLITDKKVVENTYSKGKVSTPVTICICNAWTKQIARPYLRPMSSMTEEEHGQYMDFILWSYNDYDAKSTVCVDKERINEYKEFIYSHHLDDGDLIGKGLALEAPEGEYNI